MGKPDDAAGPPATPLDATRVHRRLPHLEFINVRGFSQDRIVRSGIHFSSDPANPNAVAWSARVQVRRGAHRLGAAPLPTRP
jgi:hypothetical protein